MSGTVERKVVAGTAGAAGGGVLGTFVVWLLGVVAFGGSADAAAVEETLAAVPYPVSGVVVPVVAAAAAYLSGWWARHTPRPDLDA